MTDQQLDAIEQRLKKRIALRRPQMGGMEPEDDAFALLEEVRSLTQLLMKMSRDHNILFAALTLQAGGRASITDGELVRISDEFEIKTTFDRERCARIIEVIKKPEPTPPDARH